jgi:4-hydroxy-tetrahydrodipicolinate synthase
MFAGICAFPLTPMDECGIDGAAFVGLVARLAQAGVDSIGALGSTGNYAYLGREERSRVARLAVEAADGTPVMVGVGAVRTKDVLELVEDAQAAGAAALLLAPVAYQPLRADEVFDLYVEVDRRVSVPLCVYDNPDTTGFAFSDELYRDVARLANVRAIKTPRAADRGGGHPHNATARAHRRGRRRRRQRGLARGGITARRRGDVVQRDRRAAA